MRTDDNAGMVRPSVFRLGTVISDVAPFVPLTTKQVYRVCTHQHKGDGEHVTGEVGDSPSFGIVGKICYSPDNIHRQSTFLRLDFHMRRMIELQSPLDNLVLLTTLVITLLCRVEHTLDDLRIDTASRLLVTKPLLEASHKDLADVITHVAVTTDELDESVQGNKMVSAAFLVFMLLDPFTSILDNVNADITDTDNVIDYRIDVHVILVQLQLLQLGIEVFQKSLYLSLHKFIADSPLLGHFRLGNIDACLNQPFLMVVIQAYANLTGSLPADGSL